MKKKVNDFKFFVNGPIRKKMIIELLTDRQNRNNEGAHSMFLGQVRADKHGITGKKVIFINYTAYISMAEKEIKKIKNDAIGKFGLTSLEIFHSLGKVRAGEFSVIVLSSSMHRRFSIASLKFVIDSIKKKVPIWKREVFEEQ